MGEEINKEKLAHLFEHWIEHNESHSKSFNDWAARIKDAGFEETAEKILEAARKMDECTEYLQNAKQDVE